LKYLRSLKIPPAIGIVENRKLKNYNIVSKRKKYRGSSHMEPVEEKAGRTVIYRS